MSLREKIAKTLLENYGAVEILQRGCEPFDMSEKAADAILSNIVESVPQEAVTALLNYQQADEDGIMVLVSRQAIHEVRETLRAIAAQGEEQ